MSQITTQFRSSFNGYNREDVVDFIDRMTHAHEDALERLQKANAKLKEELEEANQALSAAKENNEAERALADAQALAEDLRSQNDDLADQNQSLKEQLTRLRAERDAETVPLLKEHEEAQNRLKQENAMLRAELAEVNHALSTARNNTEAETAINNARNMIAVLRNDSEQLSGRVRSLEEELEQVRSEHSAETESMNRAHEEALSELQNANAELQEELAAAKEALAAASDHREQTEELEQLRNANAELREALTAAKEELAAAKEAAEAPVEDPEMEQALCEAHTVIADLTGSKEVLEARVQSLEEELEQVRSQREADAALLAQTQEQLNAMDAPAQKADARDYAELELAAYRRAEQTERLARDRARDVYRKVQDTFEQANDTMSTCHGELEQLCQVLSTNVNEMLSVLSRLNSTYQQTEESFAEIGARDRQLLEESI